MLELSISVLSAALCVAVLVFIDIYHLNIVDILLLFTLFLIPRRFFNSTNTLLGPGSHFLYILMVVLGYAFVRRKHKKGDFCRNYISFICVALFSYAFDIAADCIAFYYRTSIRAATYLPLLGIPLLFLLLCVSIWALCRKMKPRIKKLQMVGVKYAEIEKYLYILSGFTVLVLLLTHIPFVMTRSSSTTLTAMLSVLYITLLVFQILFLGMLYQLADYRYTLRFKEEERQNMKNYHLALQKNLDSLADIRHDIKNLFFTMGSFVERSSDKEMQSFYREKIFPFAMGELQKNYTFSQLYQIPDETLRAFLHMKLFQAHNHHQNIQLQIQIDSRHFFLGADIIDLTRILGILLDNAFEECEYVPDSYVEIQIKNEPARCTYLIRNTVQAFHGEKDEVRGFSSKDGHMGLGLSIVKNIVDSYPQMVLNTYKNERFYIQSLNISK